MKSNMIHSVLTGVLAVSLLLAVVFCLRAINSTRETRKLALQGRQVQFEQVKFQNFANECLEYSKTNAAILPILESVGLKANPTATNAKPATR